MQETKWLSAKKASQYCYELGLPRSVKSLRRWCANGEVDAQKRQVANRQKWFIDRESLEIKIKEELEFLKHSEKPLPYPELSTRQGTDMPILDRTRSDIDGHERSKANLSRRERTQTDSQTRDLQDQILLLNNDIQWRDKLLKDQKSTNDILIDEVKGQSRYIGHLETKIHRLGESTDQTFLAAPVPKSGVLQHASDHAAPLSPEIIQDPEPHPDQTSLYG